MSQAVTPSTPMLPGPLSLQGRAIAARLAAVFPPTLFQFKFLPEKLDAAAWKQICQGSQPLLGLGFAGLKNSQRDARTVKGEAVWSLLCAVRKSNSSPSQKFYGDAQGIGVLDLATTAASVLNGFDAGSGCVTVLQMTNLAPAWADETAIIEISLSIPTSLQLWDAISKPGMGMFEELATTWNAPTQNGSVDTYTSDWENPNV